MDDKVKNDKLKNSAPRINNLLFVLLWVSGHAASWVAALLINRFLTSQGVYIYNNLVMAMLMALGTGIPSAIVQLVLIERGLKRSMRGWIPVSIIGWILSGLAFYGLYSSLPTLYTMLSPNNIYLLFPRIMFLPLFVPVALVQWAYLRRKVKSASLWVMAALAGALLFALPNGTYVGGSYSYASMMEYVMAGIAALLYSGATGSTMLYLWAQSGAEKSKNVVAAAEAHDDEDAARLERLHDASANENAVESDLSKRQKAMKSSS